MFAIPFDTFTVTELPTLVAVTPIPVKSIDVAADVNVVPSSFISKLLAADIVQVLSAVKS